MSDERIPYLQQIPAFALRQMVNDHFPDAAGEARLAARLRSELGRKPRRVRQAVARLTRQELTALISNTPEIGTAEIAACFEEYRYGSNPSFYIYLFDPAQLAPERLAGFEQRLAQALVDDNTRFAADVSRGLPPLRDVLLNDFGPLPGATGLYEGTYRFLSRLDYIDADEAAVSTYETLYGFFWINTQDGYATIHARKPEVLNSLRLAIEEAAGVAMTHLVISKQFKNALGFLEQQRFQSSRLYEPDPEAHRFRWLTIADERAYQKGYEDLERSYPELRSTRYRVTVDGKDTTVSLTCDRGALSLAGRLHASQFRTWAIGSLGEVIRVLTTLRTAPADYVQTYGLRSSSDLAPYATAQQKDLVLELLSELLTLKHSQRETGQVRRAASDWAPAFHGNRDDLAVLLAVACPEEGEDEARHVVCPVCEQPFLTVTERDGVLSLACQKRAQHWQVALPAEATLSCGHTAPIDAGTVRDSLELLPGKRLLDTLTALVGRLPGYELDRKKEAFFLRGSTLYHYPEKDAWLMALPTAGGDRVALTQIIQQVQNNYGSVTGIEQIQAAVQPGG